MKYQLRCKKCGRVVGDFAKWFEQDQQCECGSTYAEVEYPEGLAMPDFGKAGDNYQDFYFDLLPLMHRENIVSRGEGMIAMQRSATLEAAAREAGVDCKVYIYRNDENAGSGTFKDISAALAASVLKEHGVKDYCLASTGNAAVSFATYLALAGIHFTEFAPSFIDEDSLKAIREAGQAAEVSAGGYGDAKSAAAAFHKEHHVLISGGNTDPLRIESKRTMVFECLRQLGDLPTVYMQAVAGGTSPLAFEKGFRDLQAMDGSKEWQLPRMLLVQQDTCDPMVSAWEQATAKGFPEGWEQQYEAKKDVHTQIGILTAANPGNYPLVAPLARRSGGSFLRVKEDELAAYGREMLKGEGYYLGPASMVCYAGFHEALRKGLIRQGDTVLLNTGEGHQRARWYEQKVEH